LVYAIKLFLAVCLLIAVAAPLLRKPFTGLMSRKDYWRVWLVILGSACVSFLSLKPYVFVAGVAVGAIITSSFFGTDVRGRLASYWLLLLLFPPVALSTDGLAGFNRVLDLNHPRVLTLILLLPAAFSLAGNRQIRVPPAMRWTDLLVVSFPVLRLITAAPTSSLTVIVRMVVEIVLDLVLPYYVTTRGLRSASDLKFVGSRMALGFAFMAVVGLMESVLRKNVYTELEFIYGTRWTSTHVLWRGPFVRVDSTTPQPIIMAFVMLCAYGLWAWLRTTGEVLLRHGRLVALVLFIAFFATWSRGPLLGFAGFVMCLLALRWMAPMRFLTLLVVVVAAGGIATASGADTYIYEALKTMFGSSEADTSSIDYRRKLLEASIALIRQSPVWGVPNYTAYLQDLRQGEGIIDLVNTYVAVMLSAGLVGLTCFLSPHLLVLYRLLKRVPPVPQRSRLLGGSFPVAFASLTVAALFVIFTTSNFSLVTSMLLFIIAVPSAWLAMSPEQQKLADASEPVPGEPQRRPGALPVYVNPGVW
jgi:O-Antigen ligase